MAWEGKLELRSTGLVSFGGAQFSLVCGETGAPDLPQFVCDDLQIPTTWYLLSIHLHAYEVPTYFRVSLSIFFYMVKFHLE